MHTVNRIINSYNNYSDRDGKNVSVKFMGLGKSLHVINNATD